MKEAMAEIRARAKETMALNTTSCDIEKEFILVKLC